MRWKYLFIGALVTLVGLYGLAVAYSAMYPTPAATTHASASVPVTCSPNANTLVSEINTERTKLGENTLVQDETLVTAANMKVADMVNGQYYGHNFPDGDTDSFKFVSQAGVGGGVAVSEDLDFNALSPTIDWNSFKNSPAHYKSLTDAQYTRIGAVEKCVNYTVKHATGPDDNTNLLGTQAKELTVVYVADNEPPKCVTVCADGSCSQSTGRGTCSWHSGEAY